MTEPAQEQDPLSVEQDLPTAPMTINLGPSHPAMHGTVRLVVTLDGETFVEAIPRSGFLPRLLQVVRELHLAPGAPLHDR